MVLLIPQDVVIPAGKGGNDAQINTETGAVDHRILLALILGKLALKLLVQVESTVKERRTGTSGAVFLGGLDCGLLDALIVYQARVAVGAEHEHLLAIHDDLGVLFAGDSSEIRIDAGSFSFLRLIISS